MSVPTPLMRWLADNNARPLRTETLSNGDEMRWYSVNGNLIVVQLYASDDGCEVLIPASKHNEWDLTLRTLDTFVGPL